ncbi:hypothetical protein NNJEOMEG_03272 [Fundidesulfovibrio magnetotacticus]|uniref:C_GCAxxG_C_C family redox protein n=1 Tax=Fundidesulfovibrio magnetotacticus TaxID=2730080 RepID=A0A6V8LZG7_9BACT|nr:C-GCAxxG-C-C family protein [Fundidesulfovibrio magnetotacticus]GFK95409.1 hypothetical protein NNJEOMEG_03272 [Fundidesulfovibrio magnetotacticus]
MPIDRRLFLACAAGAGAGLAAGLALPALKRQPPPPAPDMDPGPYARQRFLDHWNCTQAVMESLAGPGGLSPEHARLVSTPFAAGMWGGLTCGAVTGALMALGLRLGRAEDADGPGTDRCKAAARALLANLGASHGRLDCSALLGVDMATDEGIALAASRGLFKSRCPVLVESCAREAWKLLA